MKKGRPKMGAERDGLALERDKKGLVRVTFDMPKGLYLKLKVHAVLTDASLREVIIDLIERKFVV